MEASLVIAVEIVRSAAALWDQPSTSTRWVARAAASAAAAWDARALTPWRAPRCLRAARGRAELCAGQCLGARGSALTGEMPSKLRARMARRSASAITVSRSD